MSFDTEVGVLDEPATIKILDLLSEYDAHATFFVMGEFARMNPEIIERMVSEGHEVACHTDTHRSLWRINSTTAKRELERCKVSIMNITQQASVGFRAPWRLVSHEDLLDEHFLYDASYFSYQPKLNRIKEIRTSLMGVIPADDYISLNFLHLPKSAYFFLQKNINDRTVSISYHPHNIMQYPAEFEDLLRHYSQKNVSFLTHKESLG